MKRIIYIGVIIATYIVAIVRMFNTKDIVLHWNIYGDVDWRGSNYAIIAIPTVSLLMYLIFRYYNNHPEKYNYPFNVVNEDAVYPIWKESNSWICLVLMILFLYVTLCASGYVYMYLVIVWGLIVCALLIMVLCAVKSFKANKLKGQF